MDLTAVKNGSLFAHCEPVDGPVTVPSVCRERV